MNQVGTLKLISTHCGTLSDTEINSHKSLLRAGVSGLLPVLLLAMTAETTQGQIFVAGNGGIIGEYTTSGTPVNPFLISGFNYPVSMAISGNNLFTANNGDGTVGEYTTAGVPVNPSLISGLRANYLQGVAVSGNSLYVVNEYDGTIGEYTTDGSVVNASLINTLISEGQQPYDIVIVPESSPSVLLTMGVVLLLGWRRTTFQNL
jgi:hypothetical protein